MNKTQKNNIFEYQAQRNCKYEIDSQKVLKIAYLRDLISKPSQDLEDVLRCVLDPSPETRIQMFKTQRSAYA